MAFTPASLLVLLGSGVSRASKLDGVRELTDRVLTTPLVFIGNRFVAASPGVVPMPGHEHVAAHTQCFLRLLKAYADRYYSVRTGQESNYEDVFYLARQIGDDRLGDIDNPAVDGFIREVRAQAEPLLQELREVFTADRYQTLARRACRLIEYVVASRLQTPGKIEGFDFIGELAADRALARLDLVTLNHDLIAETFLRSKGHVVVDGFDDGAGEDIRRFDPPRFDGTDRIRLLKLHGSINWYDYRQKDGSDLFAIPTNGDADHAKDSSGKLLGVPDGPLFLAGTINKILDYGSGIFAEQFYRFHQFLKLHDTILISGYGFNDKGINGRLWDWMFERPTRRMVILHEQPQVLLASARGSFRNAHRAFEGTGRLILIERWMQNTVWCRDVLPRLT